MARPVEYSQDQLTRFHVLPARYGGYTAIDWFKFYGLFAALLFMLCLTYTKHLELFDDIENRAQNPFSVEFSRAIGQDVGAFNWDDLSVDEQAYYKGEMKWGTFVTAFAALPLLLALPAVLAFFWLAGGWLVRYSKWQRGHPLRWRLFWVSIFLFYGYVMFDPLDAIHPLMSRQGLAPALNFVLLFDGKVEFVQFQWGYFLLWFLFWFLVIAAHWQYLIDYSREVWFYTKRFHRYGGSVLTGFRITLRTHNRAPVTVDYPRERLPLPPTFRGVPRLNLPALSEAQAAAVIAADTSGAIVPAPGQPRVLFVDLGRFDYNPELTRLTDAEGTPLLVFEDYWAEPTQDRASLVVPLKRTPQPGGGG